MNLHSHPWILAIRPKTLPAALTPVAIGTAMAFGDGVGHWPSAVLCLAGALSIQIATNLINDYYDFKKGADTADRRGPIRVTQAGLIRPRTVLTAGTAAFGITAVCAVFLAVRGGWGIIILAAAAIVSGISYTAGKRPLGYVGLGEVFVFTFFGPVAVAGTYYVQSLELNWAVAMAGVAPGLLSTAILVVNNLRDMDTDHRAGKMTLAVRFGRAFACNEYIFCILGAVLTPSLVYMITQTHFAIEIAAAVGFLAIPQIRMVCSSVEPLALNQVLSNTGQLLMMYGLMFSAVWILCSF